MDVVGVEGGDGRAETFTRDESLHSTRYPHFHFQHPSPSLYVPNEAFFTTIVVHLDEHQDDFCVPLRQSR